MAAQSRYSSKGRNTPTRSQPGRTLGILLLIVLALGGGLLYSATRHQASDEGSQGQWTPKLGLDLQGGVSITLVPQVIGGGTVGDVQLKEAVNIIRQRVDGFGVSEAEVTPQGSGNDRRIVVSLPGKPDPAVINLVRQSAQLRFRLVLQQAPGVAGATQEQQSPVEAPAGQPSPTPSAVVSSPGQPSSTATTSAPSAPTTATTSGTAWAPDSMVDSSPVNGVVQAHPAVGLPSRAMVVQPAGLEHVAPPQATTTSPSAPGSGLPAPSPAPAVTGTTPSAPVPAKPVSVQEQFAALDCTDQSKVVRQVDDPAQQLAACGKPRRGEVPDKYLLDQAVLVGSDIDEAASALATNSQGQPIGGWVVNLTFKSDATKKWAEFTTKTTGQQTAIVLDGQVISAPVTREAITGGRMEISGDFTREDADSLSNVLRYGALPLSFTADEVQEISPTLGTKQLQAGLLAGLIGLILVILYSLLYYRALGLVNVISLFISMGLTYVIVTLMSNSMGLRLSLAGVAGLVIGIGIAADSFVVFFERLRDEIRSGKTLRVAAETSWKRARRTIVAADAVSFLAAAVLYVLAIGSVRGFAIMLGLSTIIDILVVFLFTKPMVTLLARRKFFSERRRLSGLADTGHARPGEDTDAMSVAGSRLAKQGA